MKINENAEFIVIVGPTAVGKSQLGIEIAQKYNGEIINGDSVQIYKELNIGSAKITEQEMEGIPHHLLNIKEPWEEYNAYNFQKDALKKIEEIKKRNKLPIIVGGTGLYINTIIYDYDLEPKLPQNQEILNKLANKTNQELYDIILEKCNEEKIEIHPNNRQRNLNYGAKVLQNTPLKQKELNKKNCQIIGLTAKREELYQNIDKRVEQMLNSGLVEEVKQFESTWASQKSIGYIDVHKFLEEKITYDKMKEDIQKKTRHFAKKQWTWFKNKTDAKWYIKKGDTWQLTNN